MIEIEAPIAPMNSAVSKSCFVFMVHAFPQPAVP